ncbi:MAG: M28 family peptidase [Crocinitomicaceae bacterium]
MNLFSLTLLMLSFIFSLSSFGENVDTTIIKKHLIKLTKTEKARNHDNLEALNNAASYIFSEFNKYADTTFYQSYMANGKEYKNVICRFGSEHDVTTVVGAHYDVCGNQEGADDNASGVVGLLELARLLKSEKLSKQIELVAYTLEEPPYFRTEKMGSYIHAKSLVDESRNVSGMICLEMIGYYDSAKKSQHYPLRFLSLFYGNKGDFITVVNKFGKQKFARKFTKRFKKSSKVEAKKFTGPKGLQGIDFSDHLNYWKFGISALMITDTAFYRNMHYHEHGDKMETLDLEKMARVIEAVFESLLEVGS